MKRNGSRAITPEVWKSSQKAVAAPAAQAVANAHSGSPIGTLRSVMSLDRAITEHVLDRSIDERIAAKSDDSAAYQLIQDAFWRCQTSSYPFIREHVHPGQKGPIRGLEGEQHGKHAFMLRLW